MRKSDLFGCAFAACCVLPLPAAADDGSFVALSLVGTELSAPRPTPGYQTDGFRGLGYAVAYGYDFGDLRVAGELQGSSASPFGASDTLDVTTLMVAGHLAFHPTGALTLRLGAGIGSAKVDADLDTCLDIGGCPVVSPVVHDGGSAFAYQLELSGSLRYGESARFTLGLRTLVTGSLGLRNEDGVPFDDDRLSMMVATIGFEWDL